MSIDAGKVRVTFAAAGFPPGYVASCRSLAWDAIERAVIDETHAGTVTAREKAPGELLDMGRISLDVTFAPGVTPPIIAAALGGTCTVHWTDPLLTQWRINAFMVDMQIDGTDEHGQVLASLELESNGALTVVAAG